MITGVAVVTVVVAPTKALQSQDVRSLRKFQQTPGTYPGPSTIYEGNPFIFLFWGTWRMGYVPGVYFLQQMFMKRYGGRHATRRWKKKTDTSGKTNMQTPRKL